MRRMSLKKVSFGRSLYCKKKVRPSKRRFELPMLRTSLEKILDRGKVTIRSCSMVVTVWRLLCWVKTSVCAGCVCIPNPDPRLAGNVENQTGQITLWIVEGLVR